MKPVKTFIFTLLKTLNPRYYTGLGDKSVAESIRYFLLLLLASFIIMSVLAVPKMLFAKSDIEKDMLDISRLTVRSELQTVKPISIPKEMPIITLDTTNNKSMDSELLLITGNELYYNILGEKNNFRVSEFDFTKNRQAAEKALALAMIFLLPSIFILYYAAYLIKYLMIIIAAAFFSFLFARLMKNSISFKQSLALSFYTSTIMVLLEILSIPFFISAYMASYTPFPGIHTSAVALTAYLTLFVTSIRINGNTNLA